MRIFYCTTFLHFGAGRVLVDLAQFMKNKGHDVFIAATKEIGQYASQQNLVADAENSGIPVLLCEDLFTRNFAKVSESAHVLAGIMQQAKFDLIHSYAAIPGFAGMLASMEAYGARLPHISSVNGWGLDKKAWMKLQDILFLNSVDVVHAGSYDVRDFLIQEGLASSRVKPVYNGYDFSKIDRAVNGKTRLNKERKLIVGTVAELSERKNIRQLLMAAAILPDDIKSSLAVVIVGDGQQKQELVNLAAELKIQGLVQFIGYTTDHYRYMNNMDLFVLPSRSEGLPLVLVEAMYIKIPVIATRVQGNKEIAGEDRGVLVEIDDVKGLAGEIQRFCRNRSAFEQNTERAYRWVVANFTRDDCFNQISNLYHEMLNTDCMT